MMVWRLLLTATLTAGMLLALAGVFQNTSAEIDPCQFAPPAPPIMLRCRDGDPACDLDGACDGICTIRPFIRPLHRGARDGAPCYFGARLFVVRPSLPGWSPINLPIFVPRLVPRFTAHEEASTVKVRCARARRTCVPPSPPGGLVSVTGDYTTSFVARARAIVHDYGGPDEPLFDLFLQDETQTGLRGALIGVHANLMPGVFLPPYSQFSVSDATDLHHVIDFEAPSGLFDGQLVIAQVDASDTIHHFVHGTLDGTLVDRFVPQSPREIAIHATF
jgi:hypothetical protein